MEKQLNALCEVLAQGLQPRLTLCEMCDVTCCRYQGQHVFRLIFRRESKSDLHFEPNMQFVTILLGSRESLHTLVTGTHFLVLNVTNV